MLLGHNSHSTKSLGLDNTKATLSHSFCRPLGDAETHGCLRCWEQVKL